MPAASILSTDDLPSRWRERVRAVLSGPERLLAFAETATLEEWQWRHLAKLCQDAGNKDAEITMLNRIFMG